MLEIIWLQNSLCSIIRRQHREVNCPISLQLLESHVGVTVTHMDVYKMKKLGLITSKHYETDLSE